jgi:hypothetical protein
MATTTMTIGIKETRAGFRETGLETRTCFFLLVFFYTNVLYSLFYLLRQRRR